MVYECGDFVGKEDVDLVVLKIVVHHLSPLIVVMLCAPEKVADIYFGPVVARGQDNASGIGHWIYASERVDHIRKVAHGLLVPGWV